MAVTQSDINFINQNFPGARSIPVNQILDLASQMSVTLSDDLNRMLAEQEALDVQRVEQHAGVESFDIDISDVPLDLNAAPGQAPETPKQSMVDRELEQYDNLMQLEPADEAIDPAMFGFEPPMADGPPPMEGPPPEMYEEGPLPEPSAESKSAFDNGGGDGNDVSYLDGNPEYGETVDIDESYEDFAENPSHREPTQSLEGGSPEASMAESHKESPVESTKPERTSELGGSRTEEQEIVDEIAGDRPVFKMLRDLEEMAQVSEGGQLEYDVIMRYLKTEVADDEPLLEKLDKEHANGYSRFQPSVLLKFAKENPPIKEPTSQPSDTQEPTEEAKKRNENDKQNPENKGKNPAQPNQVESTVGGALVAGAANGFKAGAGLGYGVSRALGKGLVGGVKNLKGFYDSHQQNQMKMTSDIKSNISALSSQLDSIQADRTAMKAAKGPFEKKEYADRMSKKLHMFEKTASGFADTLGSKQGQKAARKADMSRSLDSLSKKMEKVFNGMEPGKGEKKVMENISASVEAAVAAVKAVVQAIKNAFSGPSADGPSNTMQVGPR